MNAVLFYVTQHTDILGLDCNEATAFERLILIALLTQIWDSGWRTTRPYHSTFIALYFFVKNKEKTEVLLQPRKSLFIPISNTVLAPMAVSWRGTTNILKTNMRACDLPPNELENPTADRPSWRSSFKKQTLSAAVYCHIKTSVFNARPVVSYRQIAIPLTSIWQHLKLWWLSGG